ncbi:MAG: hypothetical protein RI897_2924 [Verrucomicrobiota bacterium]
MCRWGGSIRGATRRECGSLELGAWSWGVIAPGGAGSGKREAVRGKRRGQRAEGRGRRAEGGGQRAEGGGLRADYGCRWGRRTSQLRHRLRLIRMRGLATTGGRLSPGHRQQTTALAFGESDYGLNGERKCRYPLPSGSAIRPVLRLPADTGSLRISDLGQVPVGILRCATLSRGLSYLFALLDPRAAA